MTTLGLDRLPGRCADGFDIVTQHPRLCACPAAGGPWSIFQVAVRRAIRPDGTVSNNDLRPHIQAIPHKSRGRMYTKAIDAGLLRLVPDRTEPSLDRHGKNTDKQAKFYEVRMDVAA